MRKKFDESYDQEKTSNRNEWFELWVHWGPGRSTAKRYEFQTARAAIDSMPGLRVRHGMNAEIDGPFQCEPLGNQIQKRNLTFDDSPRLSQQQVNERIRAMFAEVKGGKK